MEKRVEKVQAELAPEQWFLVTDHKNVRYLSGFTGTSGYVLLNQREAYFLTDFRYAEQAKRQCPHLEIVIYKPHVFDSVVELTKGAKTLLVEAGNITLENYQKLQEKLKTAVIGTKDLVEKLRMVKDQKEIALIEEAARITDEAFLEVCDFIKPGVREKDIARELEFAMKRKGASQVAFDFIVASGERGALPHGVASDKIIKAGEFVTLDIGAVYEGYHSDMTRTVAVEQADDFLKEIYEIVLNSQEQALKAVKAGKSGFEIDKIARDIITDSGYGENFGHGLGHGVGLDIHEQPRVSPQADTILEENMIITIEPGIYLPQKGGVRIEDLVVVEAEGARRLSLSLKELIVLC